MISITTLNYGETSLEMLVRGELLSLCKEHKAHDPNGIKVLQTTIPDPDNDEETADFEIEQYNWEFQDYDYLRIFIERIIIGRVPSEVAKSSGDDDYFDYVPNLIIETHGFLKSLTEALPYKELEAIATKSYNERTWWSYFQIRQLVRVIQMATSIFNAVLDANLYYTEPELPEGLYFETDLEMTKGLKLPLYK